MKKAKEILEHLEEAEKIISTLLLDADILNVMISGLTYIGEGEADKGFIHLRRSVRELSGSDDEYMGYPITTKRSGTNTYERIIVDGFEIACL